jgi:hypothetical protein
VRLFDTATKTLMPVDPPDRRIGMYFCGPTVYAFRVSGDNRYGSLSRQRMFEPEDRLPNPAKEDPRDFALALEVTGVWRRGGWPESRMLAGDGGGQVRGESHPQRPSLRGGTCTSRPSAWRMCHGQQPAQPLACGTPPPGPSPPRSRNGASRPSGEAGTGTDRRGNIFIDSQLSARHACGDSSDETFSAFRRYRLTPLAVPHPCRSWR